MRHVTVNVRATILIVAGILALPVLMGLGARWSARQEIDQLRGANSMLLVENGSYRAATGELTTQIQSLEGVINDLGARAALDPNQARAMAKLPAIVKSRASRRQQRAPALPFPKSRRQRSPRLKTRSASCATFFRASKAVCATSGRTSSGARRWLRRRRRSGRRTAG